MMHGASSLFGLATLVLALVGPGAGNLARAQDQTPANQLSSQLVGYVSVPSQENEVGPAAGDDWFYGDTESAPASDLSGQSEGAAPPAMAQRPPTDPSFAVLQSWSFAGEGNGTSAAAPTQPFLVDLPPESQTFSTNTEPTYQALADKSSEPHDFRISDSVKVKAQPTGGGLGGRVTLTFTFPTGY